MTTRVRFLCFTIALLALSAIPALADDAPDIRVVRLSLAQGDVQIDRNTGDGWEQAINNMPLIGGTRVYAAENSKAEIELEDGSSIRLVGPAQVSLIQLSLSADGAPVDQVEIDSGLVYIDAQLAAHADFRIQDANGESFAVTQPSRLRFKVDEQVASLAVTEGEVKALNDSSNARIHSGESYNYILGQPQSSVRTAKVPPESEDGWVQQRERYDDQYAPAGAQGGENPDSYGAADLGYYGAYDNIPGYGELWQPTGVDSDWDPFDYGAWSYYPDWGWTFVSGYPWGWAPFYFGDWCYINGRGWWWRSGPRHGPLGPGGRGPHPWHPMPRLAGAPAHGFSAPHPPAGAAHRTVAVAGSNLRVGPIGLTHATLTHSTLAATHASATGATVSATHAPIGAMTGTHPAMTGTHPIMMKGSGGPRATTLPGATSNLAHGAAAVHDPIVGQRGAYALSRPSPGRNGYEMHRIAPTSAGPPRGAYSGMPQSTYVPRSYAYGGNPAPRAYSVPSAPFQSAPAFHSAPAVSSAPHASGGSSGGFHGGGGGGGFR